jgi:hypothetical protein
MKYLCVLIVMIAPLGLMAATPTGSITSSGPLTLNGKVVQATAVSSLPVVAGDEIATSGSPAMIYFGDRSRATIEPNARVKLEARDSSVTLRVLSGSVDLKRAEGSRVSLIESTHQPTPNSAVPLAAGQPLSPLCRGPKPPPRSPHCPPRHRDCDDWGHRGHRW